MERNGYPRRFELTSDEIIKRKSASLPNYASLSIVNPFATFTHPSSDDRIAHHLNASTQKDARKRNPEKSKQFRWFRSRKVHNQVGHSDSESSSSLSSSASDATATHHGHSRGGGGGGGLLNCTSLCAKKDKHYGECPNDSKCGCERINAQEEPSPTIQVYREKTMSADNKGSCVSSRLSQSSRDLREVRPVKDLFSGFDLFTSCKRSPSLRDSLDNLNRRGKREALKARVEAQRRQYRDTSSDDEEQQWQQVKKYHSDEALHKISKEKRLREARTERFYKRKNRDDDTTRVDDDKTIAKNGNRKSTYADGQQSYSKHNFQRTLDTSTIAKANLKSGQFNELGNGILSGNNVGGGGGKPPNKNGRGRDLPTMTDTVLSCHLPIKKLGTVDGLTVGRAPTPPPRSFTKFHAMPSGDGTCWHSGRRPQSYAFETRLSPIRMNNGGTVQHATSENEARGCSNRMFQQLNGASRVKTPQPATAAPASTYAYVPNQPSPRPLSFTTTSQVIYNYLHFGKSEDAIKEPGPANTQVDMWRQQHHPLPPEPQINYMSDSQLSEKTPVQRRASVQYSDVSEAKTRPPSLYNFNSLAKPWSPGPAERVSSPVVQTAHSLMVSRPPPSPVRHSTEAFVFPPGGQGCRPGTVNSDLPSPKQQQQQLTSTNAIGASSSVNSMSTNRQGFGVNSTKENNNQQQQQLKSCNSNKMSATRPLSLVLESLESISRDRRYDERRRTRGCSPPPPPTRKHFRHTRSSNLEAIGQHLDNSVVKDHSNKGGGGGSKGGNDNLEDALLELEKIYQSMKNDDEAFYAEERLLRGRRNSTAGELNAATVKEQQQHHTFHQSRGLSKTPTMGSCDSLLDQLERACSTNSRKDDRSCDDLAYRKLARTTDSSRPASSYMGTTGSYLMLSPALSPSISIEDMMQSNNKTSQSNGTSKEPHTVLDDLAYRNIRDANLQKVVDPQPPFGIPLGPVVQASPNDYLHAQAQDLSRPKLIRRFRPDVVKDDLAYRNLRRDKKQNNNNNKAGPVRPQSAIVPSSELNFDELDSIVDVDLQYAINSRKKYRAARSLSANLSHLIGQNDGQRGAGLSLTVPKSYQGLDTEKSQSLNDLTDIFGAFPENLPKDRRHEGIGNSQSDVDQSPRQALLAVGAPKLVTRTFSDLNRSQKCNRSRQNALDSSSSTDTLTEMPNKMPETDDHKANNDIWQVRVTLGTVNTTSVRRNSQDLEKAAVNSDLVSPGSSGGGQTIQKTKATGCSTPEIVVPPRSNDSRESVMALRRNFFQFGYVSDSDAQLCRPKGSPIDEKQLDDLLNSLAQGAATAAGTAPRTASPLSSTRRPSAVVHQRSISCPQSPEDCYPRPNFLSVPTAVVTDSQIGEVSAKLVLPRLKFAGGGSASGQPLESVDRCPSMTAGEGKKEALLTWLSVHPWIFIFFLCFVNMYLWWLRGSTLALVLFSKTGGKHLHSEPFSTSSDIFLMKEKSCKGRLRSENRRP